MSIRSFSLSTIPTICLEHVRYSWVITVKTMSDRKINFGWFWRKLHETEPQEQTNTVKYYYLNDITKNMWAFEEQKILE